MGQKTHVRSFGRKKRKRGPVSRVLSVPITRERRSFILSPLARGIERPTRGMRSGPPLPSRSRGMELPLLGLAPDRACLPPRLPAGAVGSYPTFSRLTPHLAVRGGLFSVALSVTVPHRKAGETVPPCSTGYPVLRCPDFPLQQHGAAAAAARPVFPVPKIINPYPEPGADLLCILSFNNYYVSGAAKHCTDLAGGTAVLRGSMRLCVLRFSLDIPGIVFTN
jgi:hypothetical protein